MSRATAVLVPASLNLGVASVLAPVLNALLARSVEPEASIGGYALALSVMMFVALPHARVQALALVFLDNQNSLRRLWSFVGVFASISGVIAILVALTPFRDVLLDGVFATTGSLRRQAAVALVALVPFPVLVVLRTYLYGIALRIGRPRVVWMGTFFGVVVVLVTGIGVFTIDPNAGSQIAAIAVSVGAAAEILVLSLATVQPLRRTLAPTEGRAPKYDELLGFFSPLLMASFLPVITPLIINTTLTRGPHPETSVAAVALAFGVNQVFVILLWGVQPTLLSLMSRGENPALGRRFANMVALVITVPAAIVAFVPPLTSLLVHNWLGASTRLQDMTETGIRLLSLLPLILVQEAIFSSAIMQTRRTRPIVYINIIRLLGLVTILAVASTTTGWSGGVIGVVALGGALVVEAITTVMYGRRAQKHLELAWIASEETHARSRGA